MSNAIAEAGKEVLKTPKQVLSWAKARPIVFSIAILATIILAIRFRTQILRLVLKAPLVGKYLAKAMGVAAGVAALIVLDGGKAFASTDVGLLPHTTGGALGLILGAVVVLGLLFLRLRSGQLPGALSVYFPKEDSLDLRTQDGDFSVAITPGSAEVTKQFKVTASKGSAFGAWIKGTSFTFRYDFTFDQAASGGTAVNWDDLPRVSTGLELVHPLWGTMLTKETGAGPILKHVIEFIGSGYQYAGDGARAQIAAADGDSTCSLYLTYPLAQRFMIRPTDQACWIGWLDQLLMNFSVGAASTIAAVSTGAVIKTPSTLQCWMDYVLDNKLEVPNLAFWHRYEHNAGSQTIRLLSMGSFGPKATKKVERILGLYELMNVSGLGGATTSDNITRFFFEQRGVDRVTNVDAVVKNYLRVVGYPRGPKGGNGNNALHDLAGNPYTMAATPNTTLNASTLMYFPITAPGRQMEVTKAWKFAGDLTITQEYTTTPTTGSHKVVAQTIREFEPAMVKELLARAGKTSASVDVPLANGNSSATEIKKGGPRKLQGLPRSAD
jgi:hypothetical protein